MRSGKEQRSCSSKSKGRGHPTVRELNVAATGDFDAQVRQTFRNIEKVLSRAGGTLRDIVTMTVYVSDARYSKRFTDLRREYYAKDFPASALITAAGFALPEILLEITATAVVA